MQLVDRIQERDTETRIIDDCTNLIDKHVASKKGLSGLAMKMSYQLIKDIDPGYISRSLQKFLPQALGALESIWSKGLQLGDPVEHLSKQRSRVADTLLCITDREIAKSRHQLAISAYRQLRKSVKGDVEAVVPDLARIIERHIKI